VQDWRSQAAAAQSKGGIVANGEYRYSITLPPWQAVTSAEDDFREAQMAVAKIDARDMDELALKASLSCVYDSVHLYCGRAAPIGYSVALNLISLTTAVAS
jgi:hypothetical protein